MFSPDGERVAFFSTRDGSSGIYQKLTSGAGREEALAKSSGGGSLLPNDWSSDSRFILYQSFDTKTSWDLWVMPLAGDRKPFPVVQTEHGEREGRFSPDVRWMAYDSTESGKREVWIQPFPPTGSKWQISTGGGFSPSWRDDGKELYYVAAGGKLMSVAVSAGSTLEFGVPKALFQTMFREGAYGSYDVARDGQRFLMNVPPEAGDLTPITVVINWTAVLKK